MPPALHLPAESLLQQVILMCTENVNRVIFFYGWKFIFIVRYAKIVKQIFKKNFMTEKFPKRDVDNCIFI